MTNHDNCQCRGLVSRRSGDSNGFENSAHDVERETSSLPLSLSLFPIEDDERDS